MLDVYFGNSYHALAADRTFFNELSLEITEKKKFAFQSNNTILLVCQKPLARGSDLKLNGDRGAKKGNWWFFHNVWKLKLACSDKTGYVPGCILQPYLQSSSRGLRWLLFWSCLWPYTWTIKQEGFFFERVLGEYISVMDQILLSLNGMEADSGFGLILVRNKSMQTETGIFLRHFYYSFSLLFK